MSTFLALNGMGALIAAVAWFTRRRHRSAPKRHTSRGIRRLENYANHPANQTRKEKP